MTQINPLVKTKNQKTRVSLKSTGEQHNNKKFAKVQLSNVYIYKPITVRLATVG